jgi:hypothetical protein
MDQQKLSRRSDDGLPGDEDDDMDEIPLAASEQDIDLDRLFPPPRDTQEELVSIRNRLLESDTDTKPVPDKDRIARLFRTPPKPVN